MTFTEALVTILISGTSAALVCGIIFVLTDVLPRYCCFMCMVDVQLTRLKRHRPAWSTIRSRLASPHAKGQRAEQER